MSPTVDAGRQEVGLDARAAFEDALLGGRPMVCYFWQAWSGFLHQKIAPWAIPIRADPRDTSSSIRRQLPRTPGVFLFHIDCSITRRFPVERDRLLADLRDVGWVPCNDRAEDLSKRAIQVWLGANGFNTVAASVDGPADEQLVVKSNLNYGGRNERTLSAETREQLGIPELGSGGMSVDDYHVRRRGDIPESWWDDQERTIERFVGNSGGDYYRFFVAGQRTVLVRLTNPAQIKKVGRSRVVNVWATRFGSSEATGDPRADAVWEECCRAAAGLGIDFGALDVAVSEDGVPHVVDVNTTPWFNLSTTIPGLLEGFSRGGTPGAAGEGKTFARKAARRVGQSLGGVGWRWW